MYEWLDRRMLRRVDRVVCVSEGQAEKVRRAGVPDELGGVDGREVDAEVWVADAVLKHIGQGVGYFKVVGKRWEPPRFEFTGFIPQMQGRWVDYEKIDRKVEQKDRVVKG